MAENVRAVNWRRGSRANSDGREGSILKFISRAGLS